MTRRRRVTVALTTLRGWMALGQMIRMLDALQNRATPRTRAAPLRAAAARLPRWAQPWRGPPGASRATPVQQESTATGPYSGGLAGTSRDTVTPVTCPGAGRSRDKTPLSCSYGSEGSCGALDDSSVHILLGMPRAPPPTVSASPSRPYL